MSQLAISVDIEAEVSEPQGAVIWLRGPTASDATAAQQVKAQQAQGVARVLHHELTRRGFIVALLDATDVNAGKFASDIERRCFYDTVCTLAADLSAQGHIIIVATSTALSEVRQSAKLARHHVHEIGVETGQEDAIVRRLLSSF